MMYWWNSGTNYPSRR